MTENFRALCAELADELTQFNAWYIEDNGYGLPNLEALLRRCDAALAEQPVGPTDEELLEMFNENDWNHISPETFEDIVRTVLARWGQP